MRKWALENAAFSYFVVVSLALHLCALLYFRLTHARPLDLGHGGGGQSLEFSIIAARGDHHGVEEQPSAQPPRARRRKRASGQSSALRSSAPGASEPSTAPSGEGVPVPAEEAESGHLCMRDCKPVAPARAESQNREQPPATPPVLYKYEADGVKVVQYVDGGRLYSSTGGSLQTPDFTAVHFKELANIWLSKGSGRDVCRPYRQSLPGPRTLVIIEDTSASMKDKATVCAAGAALDALDHGYQVELFNFSDLTKHQSPTRNLKLIFDTIVELQNKSTMLPAVEWLQSSAAGRHDFVLITDTAIHNLAREAAGYKQLLRDHADGRAILYLIGDGTVCTQCELDGPDERCLRCKEESKWGLDALQDAGFAVQSILQE